MKVYFRTSLVYFDPFRAFRRKKTDLAPTFLALTVFVFRRLEPPRWVNCIYHGEL
jgi:hypothetical protein